MSKAKSDGVEALIFRFSWPADELPPDDTTSYDAAGYFIQAFAEENMPGHPYDIVVHIDGESGLVHGHLVAANRSLDDDTLLTTKKQVTRWQMAAAASDKMARERGMRVVAGKRPGWEVELDGIRQMRYRHALRDETAAQEALRKLRDREERAARAEAKADNVRGFIRHTIAYGVLMYRWFRVGMARYDLMREIGAAGEPPAGDEYGGMRDVVADGIAQMEHQARFRDLAGVDVIDDVQLSRVDERLDELA